MNLEIKWSKIVFMSIITAASGVVVMLFGKNIKEPPGDHKLQESMHNIQVKDITGQDLDFKKYSGKKILIVNVASKCGYTSQYKELQKLYDKYGDKVEIIAVPCNDFGRQESGSPSEILKFCEVNYGVTFPILEKANIKSKPIHPLYDWLTNEDKNGWNSESPSWNFCKYLIDEKGHLIRFFRSGVSPMSKDILSIL